MTFKKRRLRRIAMAVAIVIALGGYTVSGNIKLNILDGVTHIGRGVL